MPSRRSPESAAPFVPQSTSLKALKDAARGCRGCDLYRHATQTVFGEGPHSATLMLIGEQPGDKEDQDGAPFVGPAGGLLRKALDEAGIDPKGVYVTNVVKHFKFMLRGKKRIHQKPRAIEIEACRPWLHAELRTIRPQMIVCLGATAAQAVLGKGIRVTVDRGKFRATEYAPYALATVHPSSLLRIPDSAERAEAYRLFVAELRKVRVKLDQLSDSSGVELGG